MKKQFLIILSLFVLTVSLNAQNEIPAYRAPGYKGSVSVTDMGLLWNGVETSQGYMLNDRFYLGGGAGMLIGAVGKVAYAGRVFADVQSYWFPHKSTLTSGIRVGYLRNFSGETDNLEADITVGWSWGLVSGHGLSMNAGLCAVFPAGISYVAINLPHVSLAPVLSVAFEF